MGSAISFKDQEQFREAIGARLYEAMRQADALPDVGIDQTLLDRSHLRPPAELQDRLRRLRKHVDDRAPTYLKELVARLAAFAKEPQMMGLLALVISVVMETVYATSRRPPRGAGAESRVTELRDLMEEYLKRCRMHESNVGRLRDDTRRLEAQLSFQLTQIRGAVQREGQVNSWVLKHWVNGAVLHGHMLVQLARMDGGGTEAACAALATYRGDLSELLTAYRRYKAGTVRISKRWAGQPVEEAVADTAAVGYSVRDVELGKSANVPPLDDAPSGSPFLTSESCVEAYLDHVFSHHSPIAELDRHFCKIIENLQELTAPGGDDPPARTNQAS
ncbi:hypothetical protein GN956_G11625 [Arapaima gigas]